jgi:hypothetical protein
MSVSTEEMHNAIIPPIGGSKYTDDVRREAIEQYLTLGNMYKVSENINVPVSTIQDWKNTEWWQKQTALLRTIKQDEIVAGYGKIIDKGIESQLDRLSDGDYRLHPKTGDIVRVPLSGRDASTITAIAQDKQRILLSLPNSYTSHTDSDALAKLRQDFEALANRKEKEIEGECTDESET